MKESIRINKTIYNVRDFYIHQDHRLTIIFSNEDMIDDFLNNNQTNSIEMFTGGGNLCGRYSEYKTLYKRDGSTIVLSDNGEVEPEPIEIEFVEPEPYIPTIEEVRDNKIAELDAICKQMIENGVDIEMNGATQHFSYKTEDQDNIKDAFDLAFRTGLSVPYHADGQGCMLYTPNQITSLFVAEKTNLTHHTTYFNQLKMYINTLSDADVISAINYGDPLTDEYLDNYNAMMSQAQSVILALLSTSQNTESELLPSEGEQYTEETEILEGSDE